MSGIESWSTTPANNNQAPPFGWPAGILPSQVEPIGRQMMASLAAWYQAAEWINYNFTITYSSATVFTVPGNATGTYHVGRRVQATDGSTQVYGTITTSVFTSLTTVTVAWDTGVLQTGVTIVYVGLTSAVNSSLPNPASVNMTGSWTFTGLVKGNDGTSTFELGYKDIPQNLQSGSYTCVLSDRGKNVAENVSGTTITIPANASVAYPIGTVLTITNLSSGNISIAINTDSMTLAGTATTGTRTLAQNGIATAFKQTGTGWLISGPGLS